LYHVTDKAESSPRIKKEMGSENSFEQCDAYPTIVIAGWHVYSADYYFKELARQYWITILCVIVEYLYYQFILKRYCIPCANAFVQFLMDSK
jgi:hypothetical protein